MRGSSLPEIKYQAAKHALEGNMFLLSGLRVNWGILGTTLPIGITLIDKPRRIRLNLRYGYQLFIALHEFAHFLLRVGKTKWLNVLTPPASAPKTTNQDAPSMQPEEVKAFNPALSPIEQEFNERIGSFASQQPALPDLQ